MKVAIVTGADGFLGRHVCRELAARGTRVVRLSRHSGGANVDSIRISSEPSSAELARIFEQVAPTEIYQMAGTTEQSDIAALYEANVIFAVSVLNAAGASATKARIVCIGSAAEYGLPAHPEGVVRETDPCRPISPYGISKYAQTLHALAAARSGRDVVVARLFNPIGAGMSSATALGNFVQQLARATDGRAVLRTGALDSVRDFIDVADAARAIVHLARVPLGEERVFNISTGIGVRLDRIVAMLIEASGMQVAHEIDSARRGTSTLDAVIGDNRRLAATGLQVPPADLRKLLNAMLANEWTNACDDEGKRL